MELLNSILYSLNQYAGLFSLLAVLAAIIVPYRIYRKQRLDEYQSNRDELDAMNEAGRFAMTGDERERFSKRTFLEKKMKRR